MSFYIRFIADFFNSEFTNKSKLNNLSVMFMLKQRKFYFETFCIFIIILNIDNS